MVGTMAFLQDRCPAVVVLDKALPDMSGLSLCRLIKTDGSTVSAIVLILLDEMGDQLLRSQ
jgi:DNA-binding response OmpR family regulator